MIENLSSGVRMGFFVESVLAYKRTRFQKVLLCVTKDFGKALFLDDELQSTERDQELYHTVLTIPTVAQARHGKALVLGGGEGATAYKLLSAGFQEVIMVDIDEELVQLCKMHLSEFHRGCFDDPRLKLVFEDGYDYVRASRQKFDAIVCDLPDPGKHVQSDTLYTKEFYGMVKEILDDKGILVTQAGSPLFSRAEYNLVGKNLSLVFSGCARYTRWVPSLGSIWGFYACAKDRRLLGPLTAALEEETSEQLEWIPFQG